MNPSGPRKGLFQWRSALCGAATLWLAGLAQAAGYTDFLPCEPLDPTVQYHDINEPADQQLRGTVERNHFTPPVETLQAGLTAPLPRDIAFALRQFPNHYRALNSMARWQLLNKKPLDSENLVWTADCYFLRAADFVPDDWRVRFIYAIYLHRAKRYPEAEQQYDSAEQLGAEGAEFFYNRGLLAVDEGKLDAASAYADKAYEMGYPLKGLRDKLARARSGAPLKPPAPATRKKAKPATQSMKLPETAQKSP
ncbi:MAG: hypothetical protein ABI885_17075 [Gammaproteobacteria bacterium]